MNYPKPLVAIAIASLTTSGPLLSTARAQEPTAESVLARMQKERGAPDRVAAVKTRVIKGSWAFDQMPGGGTFTEFHGGLGQSYYTSEYKGVGTFVMGNVGPVLWEENPMAGITVSTAYLRYLQSCPAI